LAFILGVLKNPFHHLNHYFELFFFHSGHKCYLTWWKFLSQPPQIGQAIITLNTRNKTSISVTLNKIVVLWGVVLLREGWVILKKNPEAYSHTKKFHAHDHCQKKNLHMLSEPKKVMLHEANNIIHKQ